MRNLFHLLGVLCIGLFAISISYGQVPTRKSGPTASRNGASVAVIAPTEVAVGETFTVEVQIEMGTTKYSDGTPAVLGGFVLPIGFDSSMVKYVGGAGGETPAFSKAPILTNADTANQKGVVIAVTVNLDSSQPMSSLSVAKLTFVAEKTGAAFFTIDPQGSQQHASVSSALHNNTVMSIPASYKNGAVTINNKKTTARPGVKNK